MGTPFAGAGVMLAVGCPVSTRTPSTIAADPVLSKLQQIVAFSRREATALDRSISADITYYLLGSAALIGSAEIHKPRSTE